MLITVTGQPRHGKTQYSIKMLLDFIKENDKRSKHGKEPRLIYCDIAGVNEPDTPIKLPSVLNPHKEFDKPLWFAPTDDPLLPMPDGFVKPKDGSIFIYDEAHKIDWVKDTSGTLSKHPTAISMNEHGHCDFIIILITQFPSYIHTHLRGLVEYHYHSKRFNGLNRATVYKWNEFKVNPRTKTALSDVFEKDKFLFDKKYYNCYKSASAHDSMKFKLPKEWAYAIGLVIFLFALMLWRFNSSPLKAMVVEGETDIVKANQIAQDEKVTDNPFNAPLEQSEQASEMTEDDEIEELRQKYLAPHIIEMTKHDDILPTMAMAMGDKCHAYNRYNERLNIDDVTCRKLLTAGGMPKSRTSQNDNELDNDYEGGNVRVKKVEPLLLNNGG